MQIKGCEAFVTGAAGGIGTPLVAALAARGARRIHAVDLADRSRRRRSRKARAWSRSPST